MNEWEKNRFKENISKLLKISNDILIDKIDPLDGVFMLIEIYNSFPEKEKVVAEDSFSGLVGIESQADHLPRGMARNCWNKEALEKKDLEKNELSCFFKDQIKNICKKLILEFRRR
jgi:hypothetical protein